MTRLHLYILSKAFKATVGLTLLVMGIVWLTQSLRFIDMIVNHNLSLLGYLKLIVFLLPDLIATIIPICFLIACIFVFNKLTAENELPIFSAVGLSDVDIYKPIALLSGGLTVFILLINFFVVPAAFKKFRDNEYNLRNEFSASLIREGSFNFHKNTTIYVHKRGADGSLNNVFIHQKQGDVETVVIADKGLMHRDGGKLYLELFKGVRQERNKVGKVTELAFEELNYDLSTLFQNAEERAIKPYEKTIPELIFPDQNLSAMAKARLKAEGHQRILNPLLTLLDGLLVVVFMTRNHSRRRNIRKRFYVMLLLALVVHGGTFSLINASVNRASILGLSYGLVLMIVAALGTLLFSETAKRKARLVR
jgi:lipopolysaccharide export system permease protein